MTQTPHLRKSFLRTPFVGRERELADIARLLAEAAAGNGALVMIGGEPGIGKSRLAEELAALAREQSFISLIGHCYEDAGAAPYVAYVEALDAAVRTVSGDTLRAAVKRSGPEITRIAPSLVRLTGARRLRGLPTEDERPYLFTAFREFLSALAEDTPVMLTLEDLHWAGAPSLLLLRNLAQSLGTERVLIVGTHREDEQADAGSPFLTFAQDVRRLPRGHSVRLQPLAEGGVALMVRGIAGAEVPERVAQAIYAHTEGNPLFVEEVVSSLLEEGRLDDVRDGELGVPEGVRRVIGRRLTRISENTRRVLTTAAVIGRTFDYDLLAAVSAQRPDVLLDALDEAQRARLIMSGDSQNGSRLSFAHELVRQTLLTQVSLPRRQQLHLAVVRALEASGRPREEVIAELARHSVLAGPAANTAATVEYLVLAAEQAVATTAYQSAIDLYSEALRLTPASDDTRRCELLLRLGEAEKRVSDSEDAHRAFEEAAALARKLGDSRSLGRAALGYSRSWPTVGRVDEPAVSLLRDALEAAGDDATPGRAELLSRLSLHLYYSKDQEEVRSLSALGVEVARQTGDPVALARALQTRHVVLWAPEHLEERLAVGRETVKTAEAAGIPNLALWGHRPLIADLMELGDTDAAEAELATYVRIADETRQPIYLWQAAVRQAMFAIFRGRLLEGERLANEQLAIGRKAGGQNLMTAYGEQMLLTRWLQGRVLEMEPLARVSAQAAPALGLWPAVLAFIYAESGRESEALSQLQVLAADGFASLPADDTRTIAVTLAAVACAAVGDPRQADRLYAELLPARGHNLVFSEGVVCVGAADYYLGLLAEVMGERTAAAIHYTDALALNERSGGRPWVALTQHAFGWMLLARRGPGDRKHAMELLDAALAGARQLGLAGVEAGVERLQQAHAGSAAKYPDGLTRREVEVLRFIASGMSNREISAKLVLSLRTTARHVTNIYAKIGARNRADATAYCIRNNLLQS